MSDEWSVDLPNWRSQPDPEIKGATLWVHTDYDGKPDIALTVCGEDDDRVSVVHNPMILPGEIDGEELGTFADWDAALDYALSALEVSKLCEIHTTVDDTDAGGPYDFTPCDKPATQTIKWTAPGGMSISLGVCDFHATGEL